MGSVSASLLTRHNVQLALEQSSLAAAACFFGFGELTMGLKGPALCLALPFIRLFASMPLLSLYLLVSDFKVYC